MKTKKHPGKVDVDPTLVNHSLYTSEQYTDTISYKVNTADPSQQYRPDNVIKQDHQLRLQLKHFG